MTTESEVVTATRIELSRRHVVAWVNAVGMAGENDRKVSYGLCKGSSDLIGVHRPTGRFIAIECKSPDGWKKHKSALSRAFDKSSTGVPLTKEEKHAYEQWQFVSLIRACGGVSGFVYDSSSLEEICSRENVI